MSLSAIQEAARWRTALSARLIRLSEPNVAGRLTRGAAWTIAGSIVNRAFYVAAYILVARILGQTGFGQFGMLQTTFSTFEIIAAFGTGPTAMKYVSEYYRGSPEKAQAIYRSCRSFASRSSIPVIAAIWLFAPWIATHALADAGLAWPLRIGSVSLWFLAVNGVQSATLVGIEAFQKNSQLTALTGAVAIPVLAAASLAWGVDGAATGLTAMAAVTWLLYGRTLRAAGFRTLKTSGRAEKPDRKIFWSFTIPALLSGLLIVPANWAAASVLVHSSGYDEMAIYNAANHWRMAALFLPTALARVVLPILSDLYGNKDTLTYSRLLKWSMLLNAATAGGVALVLAAAAPLIMRAYGPAFVERGSAVLTLLGACAVLMAMNDVVTQALASSARMWWGFLFNGLWAAAMLAAAMALVPPYGAVGLAWAVCASFAAHLIWQSAYLRIRLRKMQA